MPDAILNNCRIWYELRGESDYLLQIGGAGFAHENFGFVADAIPEAGLYVVEGCARTNLMEQPVMSTEVVVDFLKGVDVSTAGTTRA